jgi:hypothetical protein
MSWITMVENPKAITYLYDEVPALQDMEVSKVTLDRNGPTLKFDMDFPRFADHVPSRWEKQSNTVHIEVDFYSVSDLKLSGFSTTPVFDFELSQTQDGILVTAGDRNCQISFCCQNIYIRRASGHIDTARKPIC